MPVFRTGPQLSRKTILGRRQLPRHAVFLLFDLADCITFGVAIHGAALNHADALIEFRLGLFDVINPLVTR